MSQLLAARKLVWQTLRAIQQGAFADVALERSLHQSELSAVDRRLVTELTSGIVRRQRTLDDLISRLGRKPAPKQPPDLRLLLQLGLYQLRYLSQIPAAAAVDTTVELAAQCGLAGLKGVVNGLLRSYLRQATSLEAQWQNVSSPVQRLGLQHSYPDWIVTVWLEQFGDAATAQLCEWMNQPPALDLRVNRLKASVEQVMTALQAGGFSVQTLPYSATGLRLLGPTGSIPQLPGFEQGWWSVQDGSAQLVSLLLDPQPGERVIDACAAPGGKTTHLAELMDDQGTIIACDSHGSRVKRIQQNICRLQLQSIQTHVGDSRKMTGWTAWADRVLLDVPCSGLGTLHRHTDARWRQSPEKVEQLVSLQSELLDAAATWVKPGGVLVYATCTLHPAENQQQIQRFLGAHPQWQIEPPAANSPLATLANAEGTIVTFPPIHNTDGFFLARLRHQGNRNPS